MPAVLVVDDSAVDRSLIQGLLKKNPDLVIEVASSGREAIEKLRTMNADLVITDLQMPDMNGLQLLTTMRLEFPQIPVVLTTAHGSEELAVEALQQGAASYVPKPQLASRLLPAIAEVFELSQIDRSYERFSQSMEWAEFQLSLENDLDMIDHAVELIQNMIVSTQTAAAEHLRLATALRAALVETMLRGNLEFSREEANDFELESPEAMQLFHERHDKYGERRLRFRARLTVSDSRFVLGYDGPSFEFEIPTHDGLSALLGGGGRGVLLLATFADSVVSDPDRREITIVKQAKRLV